VNAVGSDGDVDGAVGLLVEVGTFRLVIVVSLVGIDEVQVACAEDFELVVEVCSGSEYLGTEAGARIVDFEQEQRLAGVVADSCQNVGRVASGEGEKAGEEGKDAERTHGSRVTGMRRPTGIRRRR
jgi:hypothetical protein